METNAKKVLWDLKDLYDSEERLKSDGQKILDRSLEFKKRYSDTQKLFEDPYSAKDAIETLDHLYDEFSKISEYVNLKFAENTVSDEAKKLLGWFESLAAEVESNLLFLQLALAKMSDEEFRKIIPYLGAYRHFIESSRRFKDHTLSEGEEKIIVYKNITGSDAFVKFYTQLTSTYKFRIKFDGKIKTLNGSQFRTLRMHPDSKVREEVTSKLFKRYEQDALEIESAYTSVAKDYDTEAKLRGYQTPNSMRNLENQVDDSIVDALVEVTTKNNSLVSKYYRIKAQIMGTNKLKLSDIYAPVGQTQKTFSWEEAKEIVKKAFYTFDEKFGKIADDFFEKKWIHAAPMPAKEGGAFCAYSTPSVHPYVLLTFTGQIKDVMTLGHELGHGIHGSLSSKQNIFQYHTPLTMAETASTFAEMLLMDYFLDTLPKDDIVPFVSSKLEDLFATMNRQNMFTRFERRAHQKISNEGATFEELSNIYEDELHSMFGDSVEYNPEFKWEWSSIPHFFHTPFYCYAYDFAQLMVLSLYERYKEGMPQFKEKYIGLLTAGGSDYPQNLLRPFDIDLRDPQFWQYGFDYMEKTLLKRLEDEIE
jgi:oligoendopeptidase F